MLLNVPPPSLGLSLVGGDGSAPPTAQTKWTSF